MPMIFALVVVVPLVLGAFYCGWIV
ncbi:4Fe-4S binding protein [Corynebacterium rouxii]